jgi:Domain of unknown function (DUF4192)
MTNIVSAGDDSPQTQETIPQCRVRIGSPGSVLAVIPHLMGFMPGKSLVVLGAESTSGEIKIVLRYDLPDPPSDDACSGIAAHAVNILTAQRADHALIVGYGPVGLVAPLADRVRSAAAHDGLTVLDVLRVQDQRYWSQLCTDPECCPADGTPFDPMSEPEWAAMAAAGTPVLADRRDLAASVAPLSGKAADSARRANLRAVQRANTLVAKVGRTGKRGEGRRVIAAAGISSVIQVLAAYRRGPGVSNLDQLAWITVVLRDLRVRDDAWARMDPGHREVHLRMWTDITRAARPGFAAAPASLLAFVAWQCGNGALANVALDRALDDSPSYSMALLLRQVIASGVPPSSARLPMSPEEVAASYDEIEDKVRPMAGVGDS